MRAHLTWILIGGLTGALLASGCDDDGGGGGDAGPAVDAGPQDDAGSTPDAGPGGDDNDSFAAADPLTLGEVTAGRINPAGDQDYYSFEGAEGDWIVIDTQANPEEMEGLVDTVVTLFDPSMTQIAQNDDGQPRVSPDSELITRLPAAGTYFVLVEDLDGEGEAAFTYELAVSTLDPELAQITLDAEPNDDVASAQSLGRQGTFGLVAGTWDDASDVDVYEFVMGANPNPNFFVMPPGTEGYGGALPTSMWVTRMDGGEIFARITPSGDGTFDFDPSLPLGRYHLHVQGPAGGSYVIKSFIGGDNPPEMAEATNDDPATPEELEFEPLESMMQIERGFVLAQLPEGDVDYFRVDAGPSDVVSVFCGSRTAGSGIQDLMAEVTSADGVTVYGMGTETETEIVRVEEVEVPSAGEYRVRLTRGAQISDVTGVYVRCGIVVGPPDMM